MKPSAASANWETTAQRAIAGAKQLRPFALYLFVLIVVSIVLGNFLGPLVQGIASARLSEDASVWEVSKRVTVRWVDAGPAIAIAYAIWLGQKYLQRLAAGEVWSTATAILIRRVGECLLISAALSIVVVPTAARWLEARDGFALDLSTQAIGIGALGGLLTLVAGVLGNVLHTAATLKAETDSIV